MISKAGGGDTARGLSMKTGVVAGGKDLVDDDKEHCKQAAENLSLALAVALWL